MNILKQTVLAGEWIFQQGNVRNTLTPEAALSPHGAVSSDGLRTIFDPGRYIDNLLPSISTSLVGDCNKFSLEIWAKPVVQNPPPNINEHITTFMIGETLEITIAWNQSDCAFKLLVHGSQPENWTEEIGFWTKIDSPTEYHQFVATYDGHVFSII